MLKGHRLEVWNIALQDSENYCVGAFVYPETPPGYEVIIPRDPRTSPRGGDVLEVEASGGGFDAVTRFTKG